MCVTSSKSFSSFYCSLSPCVPHSLIIHFIRIYSQEHSLSLRLTDVQAFDQQWSGTWATFVHNMPSAWKQDSFFLEHTPIVMSCRYGQNQPVGLPNTLVDAARQWNEERHWEDIKYVSMAIATHFEYVGYMFSSSDLTHLVIFRCHESESQVPIPIDTILQQYPEVYDTYDRDDDDEPLDLTTYPLLDESGIEQRIYGPAGNRIRRHTLVCNDQTPACGVLVNLCTVHDMYRESDDNGEGFRRLRLAERRRRAHSPTSSASDHDDADLDHEVQQMLDSRSVLDRNQRVDAYPQAFLAKYGHVQSNRMFPLYNSFILDMEREIRVDVPPLPAHLRESQDQEEHIYVDPADLQDWFSTYGGNGAIVEPCASQIYNELSHRTRPTASQQEVCTGSITQACTGAWVKAASAIKVHDRILRRHAWGLPHQRFRNKLTAGGPAPRALRLENVIVINMHNIPANKRNGA